MAQRSGSADLPLHGGRVPSWLSSRMARLGRVIVEALAIEYGRDEVLRRLSHPFWFQAFGAVMGMDWHSSGITTSVVGALKRGLAPIGEELGIWVCGGRGRHSRNTPGELVAIGDRLGIDGAGLARTSRLVAKVDSAAVQDGFQLYLHAFVIARDGAWTVIQQGMDPSRHQARRYHWLSEGLESFVEEPHAAIDGVPQGEIINLTDRRAAAARAAQVDVVREGPDRAVALVREAHLIMPAHHDVRAEDVVTRRFHAALAVAHEGNVASFEELLLTPGIGARTVAALALVGEVIHGSPSRFTDPARFSLAHGGKDGHPFPVPLKVYDQTIRVLKNAVDRAKLGNEEKLHALRELDRQARSLERDAKGPPFDDYVRSERAHAHERGGMTVHGPAKKPARSQLELPLVSRR